MDRLNRAFKTMESIEPPAKLEAAVLCQINKLQTRQLRRKLIFSQAGLVGSTLAFFYTLLVFGQNILKSEFWSMVSLAFSDAGTVLANWHDFLYSVMETFPVLALAIILIPVFALFISANIYFNLNNKKLGGLSAPGGPLAAC